MDQQTAAVPNFVAIITGERGRREIVRPLAAIGSSCAVVDWEDLRAGGPLAHARFIPAIWRIIRAQPKALVVTDMSSAFLALILLFARLHHSRVFLRLRGDPFAETRDQLRFHWQHREWPRFVRSVISWLLDPLLFAAVDRFLPVSDWIVQRLGIHARSSVVRIPIAIEDFPQCRQQARLPMRLLAVTNFDYPQKVAALGRFLDDYGEFLAANGMTMTVAGAGISWEAFCARHGRHAQFPGFVREVAGLYAEHDVFAHFSDLDAFPYVVLEAQAAGLPVLVNRACGMIEQVEDNVNGFVVDLANRPSVEALLLRLRDSPDLRAATGNRARQMLPSRYAMSAIGAALRGALEDAAPAPAGP